MRIEAVLHRVLVVALVLLGALGIGSATSAATRLPASAATRLPASAAATGCSSGSIHGLRTSRLSYAAFVARPLAARRALDGTATERFTLRNPNGVPTVFGVLAARVDRACRATDYRVQLPIRPNGSTGWVRAADVRLVAVRTRISVDLSQKQITLFQDGRPVLVTAVAIGAPSTPTPTGRFYVNQRLLTNNPIGDYGPGAVGISAFSPVLLHWPQGGPIAIHGTNSPDMVGFAISHGCLRVRNSDIRTLLREAQEGTPVEIRR